MLAVLSPAKTLDTDTPVPPVAATQPRFLDDAATLAKAAAKLSPAKLRALMHVSQSLAELNAGRFKAFTVPFDARNARPALYTFDGDVYAGLAGPSLDAGAVAFAQAHVRILSGLYGVLRPLDLMQPYRLEMGIKLAVGRKPDLYAWWGDRVTRALAEELAGHSDQTLVNLASVEYFGVVRPALLPGRVLAIDFRDDHDGELRFNTFAGKRARGSMAGFIARHRIDRVAGLRDFAEDGYRFVAKASDDDRWLFVKAARAVA